MDEQDSQIYDGDFQGSSGRYNWSVTDTKLLLSCLEHCVTRSYGYSRWFARVSEKLRNRKIPVSPLQVMNKWKNMLKKCDPRYSEQIERIRNLQQELRWRRQSGEPSNVFEDMTDDKTNRWTERNSSLFWEYAEQYLPVCSKRSQLWEMMGKRFRETGKDFTNQQIKDKWLNTARKPSTSRRINRIMKQAEAHFNAASEQQDWVKEDIDTLLQIFSVNLQYLSTLEETKMFNKLSEELEARGLEVSASGVRSQWLRILKKKDDLPSEDYELVQNIETHIGKKINDDPLSEENRILSTLGDESEVESEQQEENQLVQNVAEESMEGGKVSTSELLAFLKQREMNQQKRHKEIVALKKQQIELLEKLLKR